MDVYAIFSAVFAALTSILAKIGISGIESNLGTAIRTVVVLLMAWLVVFVKGKQEQMKTLDRPELVFIILSGIATRRLLAVLLLRNSKWHRQRSGAHRQDEYSRYGGIFLSLPERKNQQKGRFGTGPDADWNVDYGHMVLRCSLHNMNTAQPDAIPVGRFLSSKPGSREKCH